MNPIARLTKEQYAAMSAGQLQDARRQLLACKSERSGWEAIAISISDHARDGIIATKEQERERARDGYSAIAKSAEKSAPEVVVARLIAQAAFEEYINADLLNIKNAKIVMEMLDEQLALCDTVLSNREKEAAKRR